MSTCTLGYCGRPRGRAEGVNIQPRGPIPSRRWGRLDHTHHPPRQKGDSKNVSLLKRLSPGGLGVDSGSAWRSGRPALARGRCQELFVGAAELLSLSLSREGRPSFIALASPTSHDKSLIKDQRDVIIPCPPGHHAGVPTDPVASKAAKADRRGGAQSDTAFHTK